MFDAVIFDWDGTLADTRAIIVLSFQEALGRIDLKVNAEYIERRIGIGASETFREILRQAGKSFDAQLIKQLVDWKSQIQIEHARQVQLLPGARVLLEALQGKIKVGLASMNNRSVIDSMLKVNGLEHLFQVTVTANNVSHSKPNPEIFLKCAEQLGSLPKGCVVVEDSLFGVKAAKAGGMSCIAVTTGVYSAQELAEEHPDLIIDSLESRSVLEFILS